MVSSLEKAKARLRGIPKDYTYDEARGLLQKLGDVEYKKGKASGSRVCFARQSDGKVILLHKPHPSPVMCVAAVKGLMLSLQRSGDI